VKWLPPNAGELKDSPARVFPEMVKGPLLCQPDDNNKAPALFTPVLLETTKAPFEMISPSSTKNPVFVEKWKEGRNYNKKPERDPPVLFAIVTSPLATH